jgi:hypothetical protein
VFKSFKRDWKHYGCSNDSAVHDSSFVLLHFTDAFLSSDSALDTGLWTK